jgi:tRNA threonylcarbamoyladenosine biosynthesis protein TsaE
LKGRLAFRSPAETLAAGAAVGRVAGPGLVLALRGSLGAGKTLFTKGVAKGLGVPGWRYVTSPTFTIHNVYQGRLRLHHLDLYRLTEADDLESLDLYEVLDGRDVCVIEWPDSFLRDLPSDRVDIRFHWVDQGRRDIEIESEGTVSDALAHELSKTWGDLGESESPETRG